ncbi:MAG: polysaccharide deacetylase family protein [Steroidobacteraceae bacterium]
METAPEVPILMYHGIDDDGPIELAPYRIPPAAFESQLSYLAGHGYYSISLEDWTGAIADRRKLPGRPIIISFDDGYLNFLQNAWPLLERAGFTATMFVVTDKVGQTADWDAVTGDYLQLMTWENLRSLRDRGLMIGSHTATHRSLPTLSTADIVSEGERARRRLREELGIDVTSIAFPFGHTDERVREALSQAGYSIAVGTWGGISTLLSDPLNLPRIEIFPQDDLSAFADKIAGTRPRTAALESAQTPMSMSMRTPEVTPQSSGHRMLIHPDYAQKLAAQLDALIGNFVALSNQILTATVPPTTPQIRLTQIFRQPITGKVTQIINPNEELSSGMSVGFEQEARVTLEIEPKSDYGVSPENCVNTLQLNFTGPSRWLSLEFGCEWADISAVRRYQLGIYATVSHTVLGRGVLRLPTCDGAYNDVVFAHFQLDTERRNLNISGDVPSFDFVNLDTDKRPTLLFDMETAQMLEFNLRLNYLSLYFD